MPPHVHLRALLPINEAEKRIRGILDEKLPHISLCLSQSIRCFTRDPIKFKTVPTLHGNLSPEY